MNCPPLLTAALFASVTIGCQAGKQVGAVTAFRDLPEMQRVSCGDVEIAYFEAGSGDALLFLHGFGTSSVTWRKIYTRFTSRHRVVAMDLKGFGASAKPRDGMYSPEDHVSFVIALVRELELRNVTLVGNSLGGAVSMLTYLALEKLGDNPIERMVLIAPALYQQEFPFFISALRNPITGWIARSILPPHMSTRIALRESFFDDSKISDEMIEAYSAALTDPDSEYALQQTAEQIVPEDVAMMVMSYGKVNVPVLLIWGQQDSVIPVALADRALADIPGSRLATIGRCGHMPQEECPEETASLIVDFLR